MSASAVQKGTAAPTGSCLKPAPCRHCWAECWVPACRERPYRRWSGECLWWTLGSSVQPHRGKTDLAIIHAEIAVRQTNDGLRLLLHHILSHHADIALG